MTRRQPTGSADHPWFKFYPADWRAEPSLRAVSMAARGLWIEMLCLMHEAEPRGHLLLNGRPVTDAQLAALAGVPVDIAQALLGELETAGTFSRTRAGVIYSRKMRRDTATSSKQRANVEKRWSKERGSATAQDIVSAEENVIRITKVDTEAIPKKLEARTPDTPAYEDKSSSAGVRGTRLPADWILSEADVAYAAKEGFTSGEIARMGAAFRDYWSAQPGAKGRKADWPATWRGWVRREADRHAASPRPKRVGFV